VRSTGSRDSRRASRRAVCANGLPAACGNMRLDPNTHALVLATAFMTSLTFAIFAMQVIAVALGWLLA
jgi:hypothetical protein